MWKGAGVWTGTWGANALGLGLRIARPGIAPRDADPRSGRWATANAAQVWVGGHRRGPRPSRRYLMSLSKRWYSCTTRLSSTSS